MSACSTDPQVRAPFYSLYSALAFSYVIEPAFAIPHEDNGVAEMFSSAICVSVPEQAGPRVWADWELASNSSCESDDA